jgi:transglutaminase-like putative cysteine protease
MWIPLPQSDSAQTVSNVHIDSPLPHRLTTEGLYGNRLAYFEVRNPVPQEIPVKVTFEVKRVEAKELRWDSGTLGNNRLLEGDALAPLDGEPAARAAQAVSGRDGVAGKARGVYDSVLDDVDYDKSGEGWGRGDIQYVCEVGKGNCSDFHSLFICMARAQGIPAFFEIGFPIPIGKAEGSIGGYHCWAWYEETDGVWSPVDVSEADKDSSRANYFFGTLCCNRVALTRGRDLVLDPPQDGAPVNFLIYPYVEIDGAPGVAQIHKTFSFRDVDGSS